MTGLYFGFQNRLATLRETGELHPAEYGAGVSPAEYLKLWANSILQRMAGQQIRPTLGLGVSKTY